MSKKRITKSGGAARTTKDIRVKYQPFFQPKAVYFSDDTPYVYLDMMRYEMQAPTITRGDNLLVAADCLRTVYSPEMKLSVDGDTATLSYKGTTVQVTLGQLTATCDGAPFALEIAAEMIDGRFYLDVENVMESGFGKSVIWQKSYLAPGDFLGIADKPEDMFQRKEVGKDLLIYKHKKLGVLRRAYYFEEADIVMPYLLYVPTSYDGSKPITLVMVLHGAGDGCANNRDLNFNPLALETAAEERNMMLLLPEGYAMGFYGGATPALQPENCSEEEKVYLAYCQHEPMEALKQVQKEFNIDEKNIFITGNSMGGCGTFWLSLKYPEVFRALAPCGALTDDDLSKFDLTPIQGKPLLMVDGTENMGFETVPRQVAYFNAHGVPAEMRVVAGGVHASAWAFAFDKVLDFFEGCIEK